MGALKNKSFRYLPTRNLACENPHIVISRFLLLCSKYSAPILESQQHRALVDEFNSRKVDLKLDSVFKREAYFSYISKVLKSIVKSKRKICFIRELIKSKILGETFDELNESLRNLVTSSQLRKHLLAATDNQRLIKLCAQCLVGKSKMAFDSKIEKSTATRNWDKTDNLINSKVP